MGYDYSKKLENLKAKVDDPRKGLIGAARGFFLSLVIFLGAVNLFSFTANNSKMDWIDRVEVKVDRLSKWISSSPVSVLPGGSFVFNTVSQTLIEFVDSQKSNSSASGFREWLNSFLEHSCEGIISALFFFIAIIPLWIIGGTVGYFAFRSKFASKGGADILGICTRGAGPYYSGIYGPLRSNGSVSGIDYSAPGLACPGMVEPKIALNHRLVRLLKTYGGLNQTNLDLVRIILKYGHFPSFVESEQTWEDESTEDIGEFGKVRASNTGFYTNSDGIVEEAAIEGLLAVMSAHHALRQEFTNKKGENDVSIISHRKYVNEASSGLTSLGVSLLSCLTPERAQAFASIDPKIVASAYLSTEAGKCLVYKPHGKGFLRISLFPHLQARAVIQSLPAYHTEYNGDIRQIIRLAIISSRRHGDFGRAFLPLNQSVESRALRDVLEIMFMEEKKRESHAHLVELDAHIDELHQNFRSTFGQLIKQSNQGGLDGKRNFWKGIVHRAVVLTPLTDVVGIAFKGIDNFKLKRITEVLQLTRKYEASIAVSTRLPGLKRQASELAKGNSIENAIELPAELLGEWVVVRRMLIRYNWLATRVGDEGVQSEGYVRGIVVEDKNSVDGMLGFPALVPLRNRRFEDLFGKNWQHTYYSDTPNPNAVFVYMKAGDFADALKNKATRVMQSMVRRA